MRDQGLQLGHSDLTASGPLGPWLRGHVGAMFATHEGKLEKGIEEAYVETTALPAAATLTLLAAAEHLTKNIAKAAARAAALTLLTARDHLAKNIAETAAASAATLALLTAGDHLTEDVAKSTAKTAAAGTAGIRAAAADELLKHFAEQTAHAAIAHRFIQPAKQHGGEDRQ